MATDRTRGDGPSEVEAQLFALALIQGTGAGIAFIIQTFVAVKGVYTTSANANLGIMAILAFLFAMGAVVGLLSQPLKAVFFLAFKHKIKTSIPTLQIPKERIRTVVHLYAILDFVGLAIFICYTGGSERSFFAPFLFVVSTIIVLVDVLPPGHIAGYAFVSVAIFALGLCETIRSHLCPQVSFIILHTRLHKICLIGTTGLCFFFPLVFDLLAKMSDENNGPKEAVPMQQDYDV